MTAAFDRFQRELIVENTRAGLAAAHKNGRRGGRPPSITVDKIRTAESMIKDSQNYPFISNIIKQLEIGRTTFYCHFPLDIRKPLQEQEIFDSPTKHLGVIFKYMGDEAAADQTIVLKVGDFQKLPRKVVIQLLHAVEFLDRQLCLDVIAWVGNFDNALADRLRLMVDNLDSKETTEI